MLCRYSYTRIIATPSSCLAENSPTESMDFCEQEVNLGYVADNVNWQQITSTVEKPMRFIGLILEEGNYIKIRNDQEL